MAYKALNIGSELKSFHNAEIKRDNLKHGDINIIAHAELNKDAVNLISDAGRLGRGGEQISNFNDFDLIIISNFKMLYPQMKFFEDKGFPRNRIIDERVFQVPDLDFARLLEEGVAYSNSVSPPQPFCSFTIYPQVYKMRNTKLSLGRKSYIDNGCCFEGHGEISIGKFSCLASGMFFSFLKSTDHNHNRVSIYSMIWSNFNFPAEFSKQGKGTPTIHIGSDVWIGRRSNLKCTNPNKPLIIGDGAVIASDSVVVKDVPPYAIVGGNPAQIIKYRFSPDVIESMLKIKWWDWSLDKIHDNFKYFNDLEKFISMHDRS